MDLGIASQTGPPRPSWIPSTLAEIEQRVLNPEVLIEITSRCNFACDYCTSPFKDRPKTDMKMELFEHVVKQLPAVTTRDVRLHVDGEPTMHPRFRDMVALVNRQGLRVGLATNGSRLDPSWLDLDIAMTITVSTTPEEFTTRHKKMDFRKYVETFTTYVREWARRDSPQTLFLMFIYNRPTEPSGDRAEMDAMVARFIEETELRQHTTPTPDNPNQFWKGPRASTTLIEYTIVGGGLYPVGGTLVEPPPTEHGFCNSPWQRLTVLSDGRVGFCCVDLSGKATHTGPREIWQTSLLELWLNHPKVQHVRNEFKEGRVSEEICRKCLAGRQPPVLEHAIY